MYITKIKNDNEFINELNALINSFKSKELSEGLEAILQRLEDIYDIVHKKKNLLYNQEKYSFIGGFEDVYQDAVDFFKTPEGEKVIDVLHYFAYAY